MDDTFQFIIESPQHTQGHKKRPRLVTSCDNCRLKKIKCLQPSPETKCEACKAAKIPCRFRDRERYFAERSRAIAGSNVGSSYGDERRPDSNNPSLDAFSVASSSSSPSISSASNTRSNSHSPKASGVVCPDGECNGRYQSYPPDPRRSTSSTQRHAGASSVSPYLQSRPDPSSYNFVPAGPAQLLQNSQHARSPSYHYSSRPIHLFDPDNPQRPHPSLMPHFIQLFFEQVGGEYPFLAYDEIITEFWEQRLPPLLANCIAAMSARYSNLAELAVRGLHNVVDSYTDNAKTILAAVGHIPSMDTLHALILLSWLEFKNSRTPGFKAYCGMAMKMAADLRLSDQNPMDMTLSEREANRRRSTWTSVFHLQYNASSTHSSTYS